MKKLNITVTTLILAMALAACGTKNNDSSSIGSSMGGSMNSASEQSLVEQENKAPVSRVVYGKVTSIVGNEIELSLAKYPDVSDENAESENSAGGDMDSIPAATMTPAITGGGEMIDVGSNLEYTGESLTLTISAGAKITMHGKETTLSALKKGSILSVLIDDVDTMNVGVVDIME